MNQLQFLVVCVLAAVAITFVPVYFATATMNIGTVGLYNPFVKEDIKLIKVQYPATKYTPKRVYYSVFCKIFYVQQYVKIRSTVMKDYVDDNCPSPDYAEKDGRFLAYVYKKINLKIWFSESILYKGHLEVRGFSKIKVDSDE